MEATGSSPVGVAISYKKMLVGQVAEHPMVGAVKVKCTHVRSEGWSPHILSKKGSLK